MIHTFRLNPLEYLTVTAARRNVAADVASIIRIHAFLEQWGLINYQIDPKTKPSLLGPQFTGHFQIILDTPDGLKPFIPENAKIINVTTNDETKSDGKIETDNSLEVPLNLELRRNVYDSTQDALALNEQERLNSTLNTKQYTCTVTGNDSAEVRYHNLKAKNSISSRAFKEGQFGSNFQSSDFVKLENLQNHSDAAPWTDQEVLLLLEGVELYEDDWEKVSQHIGSRTKAQAISKFIQLPIEDKYLTTYLQKSSKVNSVPESSKSQQNSTNDAVLKTIKFLIKNIDPELASKDFLQNNEDIQKAIKLTLGSIVGHSEASKDTTKNESNELLNSLVDLEINKVDLKLQKLSILEKQLNQERSELSQQRKDLILDRLTLKKQTINVRNKLVEAAQAETPDEGVKLADEAWAIAKKAPRIAIIANPVEVDEAIEIEELDQDKSIAHKEEVIPVSVDTPESYQFWKL
jgi:chromatin structure-remodeling complex subunit RSC8